MWLKIVENKRSVGSVIFNLYNLILLVLSLLFGYFVPKDDSDVIILWSSLCLYDLDFKRNLCNNCGVKQDVRIHYPGKE